MEEEEEEEEEVLMRALIYSFQCSKY